MCLTRVESLLTLNEVNRIRSRFRGVGACCDSVSCFAYSIAISIAYRVYSYLDHWIVLIELVLYILVASCCLDLIYGCTKLKW